MKVGKSKTTTTAKPLLRKKKPAAKTQTPPKPVVPPAAPLAKETPPRPQRQLRPVPIKIPPLLLEPDHLPGEEPILAGPGARFVATPQTALPIATAPTELPESYGTQQIFLAARDPYWLLASWDLSPSQQRRYNAQSASGALTVRLRRDHADGPIHLEVHTQADSKDWFIHCGSPGTTFVAELGLHAKNSGAWQRISVSKPVATPRDRSVPPPVEIPTPAPIQHAPPPREAVFKEPKRVPSPMIVFATPAPAPTYFEEPRATEIPIVLRSRPLEESPRWNPAPAPAWTPEQAKALDELISIELRKTQQGSIEIEELLRRHIGRPESAAPGGVGEAPSSFDLALTPEELLGLAQAAGPSSADAAPTQLARKGFWFKVNAELIIYGSTEPNAHVSIGGRPIRLREDGSFSYRFALPDGAYELPVIALSQDGDDGRAAELRFSRQTHYSGEVGAHPQDRSLKLPSVKNL